MVLDCLAKKFKVRIINHLLFKIYDLLLLCCIGTDNTLTNIIKFEVNHNLYKGRLLVPHQITETSRNRNLVYEVESYFQRWMRQIQTVITQGIIPPNRMI